MNNESHEHIEIVRNQTEPWRPVIGEEISSLLRDLPLDQNSRNALREEAVSILARCVPPTTQEGQRTGLVVGHVQSGKTLSFTAVTALARDNNFPIAVIIAGTSIPLTDQSQRRLRRDLRIDTREDRCWRHLHNPKIDNGDHTRIANILEDWRDPGVPASQRSTILITVMKHHGRLRDLINVLSNVGLENIPVLLIDDEADQAGLNNLINDEGDESATYRKLRELKEAIPHHTFLQYTATPQGPLLINLIDVLSPRFAITLTPGDAYTGGRQFFIENRELIRNIPPHDIPMRDHPLREPPESLLEALRIFFLGIASGLIRDDGRGYRSMMVHPSQRTRGHQQSYDWITQILNHWRNTIASPDDPDAVELLEEFRHAHNEGWFYPKAPHDSRDAIDENNDVIDRYLGTLDLVEDEGHPDRSLIQRHQVASSVSIREAYEHLLMNLQFTSLSDAQNFLGIMVVIRQALEQNPDERCRIYVMSSREMRLRTLNDQGEIPYLFQGAAPVSPRERRGEIYPGDRYIRSEEDITIQIHNLELQERDGRTVHSNVPNIAIHIPGRLANDVLIQDQGGVEEVEDA